LLCETLARLPLPPRVLICASATGFYGDRGHEILDERSGPGTGFLPEVCRAWEAAAGPARQRGIRVVDLLLGIALAAHGGALTKMLPAFRLGLGGRLGSGRQHWSWIALDDLLNVIEWALRGEQTESSAAAMLQIALIPTRLRRLA
jgi:NAD dependent epimerase/dehydratase family enzyme